MRRILFTILLLSLEAPASTIVATSCSSANVQAAINSAVTGDTVQVPGGSCSWSPQVNIPSTKGNTLDGQGITTITNSAALLVNTHATVSTRVTGFTFTAVGDSNNGDVTFAGGKTNATYRLDHNTFTNSGTAIFVASYSNNPGLIDHDSMTGGGASEMIHNFGMGASDASGWTDDVTPGGPQMLFIEDNTFTFSGSGNFLGTSAVQSYYGARTVVRHNTMNMVQIDQHGTAGNIGARWWEIYNNNFVITASGNQDKYMDLRAGSGVVFNNTKSGSTNLGAGGIVLHEEDTGTWPLAYQIGSGINGGTNGHVTCSGVNNSPAYLWGNQQPDLAAGAGSGVQANRDLFESTTQPATLLREQLSTDSCATTYAYTPFTYPHPLQGVSTPAVSLSQLSVNCGNSQINNATICTAVTLTNTGSATLSISSIAIAGTNPGDFTQGNTCPASLSAGLNCSITPTFTPTVGGVRSATVSITDNASDSPQSIALSGTGGIPVASLSPSSLAFGSLNVSGSSAPQSLTLSNTGSAAMSITSISFTGSNTGDFFQSNNCPVGSSLGTSSSCTITVTFTPLAIGARSASLSVVDGASGSPHTSTLSGTGVQPMISGQMNPGVRMSGRATVK